MIYLFLQIGNDKDRYFSNEQLYKEAKKYFNKNLYMAELEEAINFTKNKCKNEIIMIVRKFLCVWNCFKHFKEQFMIEINNLNYKYRNSENILENINLKIRKRRDCKYNR